MKINRIEVPLTPPHFDDEATIVSARRVVPIAQARKIDRWQITVALLVLACICGALGAVVVSQFEDHQMSIQPAIRIESQKAIAASRSEPPNASAVQDATNESSETVTSADRSTSTASSADNAQTSPVVQPRLQTRKRRFREIEEALNRRLKRSEPHARGAGRIQDIFNGSNP